MFAILITSGIDAQTIAPLPTSEVCPNTEYTFSVTLPSAYTSITTSGGCNITLSPYNFNSTNTSFLFKGTFADQNQTQTFTVNYGGASSTPFSYTRVKSLTILRI